MKPLTGLPPPAYLKIAEETSIQLSDLLNLVQDLETGLAPAYIAHCRRHASTAIGEELIADIRVRLQQFLDLEDRRISILGRIDQQRHLTPEIREQIESVTDRRELEELYLPFKPRKKMAADEAIEHGLEPLAVFLRKQEPETANIEQVAKGYVNPKRGVNDVDKALRGARHIVARWLGENAALRRDLRPLVLKESEIVVHPIGDVSANPLTRKRIDLLSGYRAKVDKVSWRQELTIRQASRDGLLRCEVLLPEKRIINLLLDGLLQNRKSLFCLQLEAAANEAYTEFLTPAFRNEVLQYLEERSDIEAVRFYQNNLRKLLLTPAAGPIPVIGLEVERSGNWCAAVVGADSSLLESAILLRSENEKSPPSNNAPDNNRQNKTSGQPPDKEVRQTELKTSEEPAESSAPILESQCEPDSSVMEANPTEEEAGDTTSKAESVPDKGTKSLLPTPVGLHQLISKYKPAAFAIANGPGVRQLERALRSAIHEAGGEDIFVSRVSDAGIRAYSTSKTARKELPGVSVTIRNATTLARRLQDPLTELVKVEPRTLGLGPNCQTVNTDRARAGLRIVTTACVSKVGVDINKAPPELLAVVPALTGRIAKRIVEYRESHGLFEHREQLCEIPGFSEKIYQQAVPFLRIRDGENPLDGLSISPQSYNVVNKMLLSAGVTAAEAIENPEALNNLNLQEFSNSQYSIELLKATVEGFKPEVRNPRGKFEAPRTPVELRSADELKVGMKVEGVVTKVTRFGAFVDIGTERDGLLHISELLNKLDKESNLAIKTGDHIKAHILTLQKNGGRISLSKKEPRRRVTKQRTTALPHKASETKQENTPRKRRKNSVRETTLAKRFFGPNTKQKQHEKKRESKLPLNEKLSLLETRFRTKI